MAILLRAASAVIFFALFLIPASGQPLSPRSSGEGFHSRARLLSGGEAENRRLAGIAIDLDPGFKTYWRNPGDSGLPPRFDWSGSENVSNVEVRWPAPTRHEDAAGVAYIYTGQMVLPVLVTAKEPGKPVKLALSIDYGICKDICIPAHADLDTVLSGDGQDRAAIEAALAKVPLPRPLGAPGDLSVLSVEPTKQDKPAFTVAAHAPAGSKPALFAEGPDDWYLSTSEPDDANRFTVVVEERPKDVSGPVPIRLTLVAGEKAVETEVSLDVGSQPR